MRSEHALRLWLHWPEEIQQPGKQAVRVGELGLPYVQNHSASALRLNHHAIMSWERFRRVKMSRGDAFHAKGDTARTRAYFDAYDRDGDQVENVELKEMVVAEHGITTHGTGMSIRR